MIKVKITAPRMQKFQDTLAKLLRATLVILDRDGKILTKFNLPLFLLHLYRHHFDLEESYMKFFKDIPDLQWNHDDIQVIKDPLGLSTVALCLNSSMFIVLMGYLDDEPQSRDSFLSLLKGYGFNEGKDILPDIPNLELAKQKDQARQIRALYHLLVQECEKEDKGCQNIITSMVLDQINKLMLSLLNSETFELRSLLELIASTLIMLLDAQGAWIFTYQLPQGSVSVHRGAVWGDMISDVQKEWEEAVNESRDPQKSFFYWQESSCKFRGFALETIFLNREKVKIFLGAVNPDTDKAVEVLAAFSRQIATVLDIASIYQALQQRLRSLLHSIRHGIIVTDQKAKVALINQAAMSMLTLPGFSCGMGDPIEQCPLDPEIIRAIEEGASLGTSFLNRQSTLKKDENSLHLNWDVVPLLDDDATILGAILLFKDITKEVNLRRQLQESERLAIAGEVAASLAHEIRNPLTVALGSLQFWAMVDDPLKQRELLDMTRNELKRMNHILTNFLNLSKPGQVAVVEEFNPENEIEELVTLIKSEALLNDIDLEVLPCPQKLPAVRGSKNDLKQVCLNVAKNAIEAMEQGGKLSISLSTYNGQAWITFRDNGPGISEENLRNIFRPFFTTKLTGTGLGLYICYNIIKDMGGELRFESELGQGTSVHIILPPAQVQEREVK